jgi:biotin carboxylase
MGQRTLLFLGASVSQLPAINHARAAGYRVVAVDGDPNAIAFPHADLGEQVDFTDIERVIAFARRVGVDGVLAISSDRAVVPAAAVASALGLPGIGVDVAEGFTNKAVMRDRLAAAGVPQPRSRVLGSAADVEAALAGLVTPLVLKPVDSGGQRGLFMVETAAEIRAHLPEVLALSRRGCAILEEYQHGTELNGLLAVRRGEPTLLTFSDRLRPTGVAFGVGWIHSFPSSLPRATLAEARDVAFAAVRALGLRDGIAFPQLIATADGVRLVEVAARIAAGQMADLVLHATGINLFDIAIAQALGDDVPDSLVTPAFTRPIAIRFLTARPGVLPVGTIAAVDGLEAVRDSPGVLAAGFYVGAGAKIRPLRVDADRNGYVIATAADPVQALELADAAARKLVVRMQSQAAPLRRRFGRRRTPRVLVGALTVAVVLGAALSFVFTDGAKPVRALITGTRVSGRLSPFCNCPHDVARIAFRLVRPGNVTLDVVNSAGRPVATLVDDRLLQGGVQRFAWRGRNAFGEVLPNGDYRPEVIFDALKRRLVLARSIVLDTTPPELEQHSARSAGGRLVVRYRFDEPAHALLLVDGRLARISRSSEPAGRLAWNGVFPGGRRVPHGPLRVALAGVDLAGNRSTASRAIDVKFG